MNINASELISRYTKQAIYTKDKVLAAKLWEKIRFIKNDQKKKIVTWQ